jgi:hypothetical protein
MRRALALSALLAALPAAVPRPAAAATFVATTVEHVARTSDAVARGHVVRTEARTTKEGRIVTDVEIAIDSAWKGTPEATVRVVVPGGRLPGIAARVDGAPTFAPGEDVVVFLARGEKVWHVNGLALGKFRVVGGEARPSVDGAAVLPRALPSGEREVGTMPVAELERRVRAAR